MLVFVAPTDEDAPRRSSTAAPMPGTKTLIYEAPFQFRECTGDAAERSDGAADGKSLEFGAPLGSVFPPTLAERWSHASCLESNEADPKPE